MLTDELSSQLQGEPLQQIATRLGMDAAQTQTAVSSALPLLLGALGRNTQQPGGSEALADALQRDHATPAGTGFDLGQLVSAMSGGPASRQTDGAGILGHIFGKATPQAANGLGQVSGLDAGQSAQLLKMLAPIVMSFLAQRFLGNGQPDRSQLSQALGQEHAALRSGSSGLSSMIGSVLDQDGDGDLDASDLLKLGSSLFVTRH